MASMRLLIAVPSRPPSPDGAATFAALLEQELPAHEVRVAVLAPGDVSLPGILRHLAYFFQLLCAGKDADAILALDIFTTGIASLMVSLLLRKPFFLRVAGDAAWERGVLEGSVRVPLEEFLRTRHVSPLIALLRSVQGAIAQRARKVFVPSAYFERVVAGWGVPRAQIAAVPAGFLAEAPGELPEVVQGCSRPRVVAAGRLVPWHGHAGLIEAMVRVREVHPTASLVIAGEGPEHVSLVSYARVRLGDAAIVFAPASRAEMFAVLADADLIVRNTTFEAPSYVLIESLALGKPVIATATGGAPEVIEDGKNGLLVPSGDRDALREAIVHVLATPKHGALLGEGARTRAQADTAAAAAEIIAAQLKESV